MLECSCEKTITVLHCLPHMNDIINFAVDVAVARGFYPHAIHDVKIDGEKITFQMKHQIRPRMNTLVSIELSFKDLIENPEQYMVDKLLQETGRFANDNNDNVGFRFGRK